MEQICIFRVQLGVNYKLRQKQCNTYKDDSERKKMYLLVILKSTKFIRKSLLYRLQIKYYREREFSKV